MASLKLTVLHLSDIHIKGSSDPVLGRATEIASACFSAARQSSACLIIVTGDIAWGGSAIEYSAAEGFLNSIRAEIEKEGGSCVDVFMAPGNHDCVLVPENLTRSIVIERLVEEPALAERSEITETCTQVQKNFFTFRERITKRTPKHGHSLWTEYELLLGDQLIRLSVVNAAWMSRNPERPGTLILPAHLFEEWLAEPATLRLAIIHHPLNWYAQSTYHPLRKALRSYAHVVLSGHEHVPSSSVTHDPTEGENLCFEAASLQPHNPQEGSGFSVLAFDLGEQTVGESRFLLTPNAIERTGEELVHPLRLDGKRKHVAGALTQQFEMSLRDPGGNFTHPDKDRIQLDDIFVYPDVHLIEEASTKDSYVGSAVSAERLLTPDDNNLNLLFLGADQSGKSTLLLRAFRLYHSQGLVPICLKASNLSSTSTNELEKAVLRAANSQYADANAAMRAPHAQRIALIDDIDRFRGGGKELGRIVEYLKRSFSRILTTASPGFEVREFVDADAARAFSKFSTYEILPLGHRLRHQLIKKWCCSGAVTDHVELDRRIHDSENVINDILGKNLVPRHPIYVLILLQASDRHQQTELRNSSFAYYYQYLITKSLKEVGAKLEHLNELFHYLACLAWFFKGQELRDATRDQLQQFNRVFSDRFVSVDLDQRLRLLSDAKILSARDDYYSFSYPYVYFFFLGKYLADTLHEEGTKRIVTELSENLHKRENAHSILFLAHHQNDPWVIQTVADALKRCLADESPIKFDGDIAALNGLIDSTYELILAEPDVPRNQERSRRLRDEWEERTEGDSTAKAEPREDVEFAAELSRFMKTTEILGQILKSYYGSIERSVKSALLQEVFNAPLRLINAILAAFVLNPEALINSFTAALSEQAPSLASKFNRDAVRKFIFNLLGQMSTGLIARTAQGVNSKELGEDILNLVTTHPSNAYRLISVATRLTQPSSVPMTEIAKLAKDLRGNAFAFKMLQSLAVFRIHQFHTRDAEKQQLCKFLDIKMTSARAIGAKGKSAQMERKR